MLCSGGEERQRNRLPDSPPVGFFPGQRLFSAAMLENSGGVGSGEFGFASRVGVLLSSSAGAAGGNTCFLVGRGSEGLRCFEKPTACSSL